MSEKNVRNQLLEGGNVLFSMMMLAVIAMVVSIGAIGVVSVAKSDGASAGSASATTTVNVTLTEFAIKLSPETIPPGNILLSIHNAGSAEHNVAALSLNKRVANIPAGGHIALALGSSDTAVELICEIAGHLEAGMKTTLGVDASASGTPAAAEPAMTYEEMDKMMKDVALQFPAKTEGLGNQELEPTIVDGVKVFNLTAKIIDWEVEQGKIIQGWAYNGQIPGPILRANVGDKVSIVLKNELPESTSMHLHGIRVPNAADGVDPYTQEATIPGESHTYNFTALEPSVGMYHSHHNAQIQVPNGLAGAFIIGDYKTLAMKAAGNRIEDKDGIAEQEVVMVLNDAGTVGLSLNGKSFPATTPYSLALGETMVVHYFNEGMMVHPMHLHQPHGLVVARDGKMLESPYFADTVSIAPGERWTVVYTAVDPGVWAWHCHILTHAETATGMKYMVTALIVK
jgi:FtsP/CotA-like multicopper oxidase with cupredoxin domain